MKKWLFLILLACAIMYYFLPMIDESISESYNEEFGELDPNSVYEDDGEETAWDKIKEFFENLFESDKEEEYIYR